jgi:hypothetical protein
MSREPFQIAAVQASSVFLDLEDSLLGKLNDERATFAVTGEELSTLCRRKALNFGHVRSRRLCFGSV